MTHITELTFRFDSKLRRLLALATLARSVAATAPPPPPRAGVCMGAAMSGSSSGAGSGSGAGPSAAELPLSDGCVGRPAAKGARLPIAGDESLMSAKAHGTCAAPVRAALRWGCDVKLADRICCYNRHYAEHSGYFEGTAFLKSVDRSGVENFFDSVSGKLLFSAPRGRSWADFIEESRDHGWPSFRDEEVAWDQVRVLPDGECVSLAGTHLGHNLPDRKGNRYCINLVSVAALPPSES